MFFLGDLRYRAGVFILLGSKKFAYSQEFFMKCFIEFMQQKIQAVDVISRDVPASIKLTSVGDLFRASQSIITTENNPNRDIDRGNGFTFRINGRNIYCPHDSDGYVYDFALNDQCNIFFPNSKISYLQMARFLQHQIGNHDFTDVGIANDVISIVQGEEVDDTNIEVLSIIIASLLIAESKRNPCCFLPTLMGFDLISNNTLVQTPFGDQYKWSNCLQNQQLVSQNSQPSFRDDYLFPRIAMMPNRYQLQTNQNRAIESHETEDLNALRQYNRMRNQRNPQTSEYLMQHGGYFPNTHRFSFTEIQAKRAQGKLTLADKKCFILISDWLALKGQAETMHEREVMKYEKGSKKGYPELNSCKALLMRYIFPAIWRFVVEWQMPRSVSSGVVIPRRYYGRLSLQTVTEMRNEAKLDFSSLIPADLLKGYPRLLNQFGCRKKKVTAAGVANVIFLLHGSDKHGPEIAKQVKHQFNFWNSSNDKNRPEEIEKVLSGRYGLS